VSGSRRRVVAADAAATEAVGAALARSFEPRPDAAVKVHLRGDLGAGKTTLARGLLRELGVRGAVRSPSFALLEEYATPRVRVLHLDLYRLAGPADLRGLGLADHDEPGALWLVEWPERGGAALGTADLVIALAAGAIQHQIELEAASEVGRAWLERLDKDAAST
jgi:tRNA threonylcarbamoyladenosine biosynthesis protein TsaE